MTAEEIKQSLSMRDVLERYGVKVKRNMCSCPFHGEDKHPSMKVFKDGFKCFGCGLSGAIFTFVQNIEECDFKQAFYILGGSYEHSTKASQIALYHAQKQKEKRERIKMQNAERQKAINDGIHSARAKMNSLDEGSDEWWDSLSDMYDNITKDLNMEGGD